MTAKKIRRMVFMLTELCELLLELADSLEEGKG